MVNNQKTTAIWKIANKFAEENVYLFSLIAVLVIASFFLLSFLLGHDVFKVDDDIFRPMMIFLMPITFTVLCLFAAGILPSIIWAFKPYHKFDIIEDREFMELVKKGEAGKLEPSVLATISNPNKTGVNKIELVLLKFKQHRYQIKNASETDEEETKSYQSAVKSLTNKENMND